MGAYNDAQSAPYEGHERVSYVAYKWETIMKITDGTATSTVTGELNDTAADFVTDSVSINDEIVLTIDGADVSVRVASIGGPTKLILSDDTLVVTSADAYIIYKGNKPDQANVVKAISEGLDNRRVTHIWSGDFQLDDTRFGERLLPGWYACAATCGLNENLPPSQ